MRLGQLARKLALRPSEIIDFLSSQKITIDDGANTKLSNDHVELLLAKFAPLSTAEQIASVEQEPDETPEVTEPPLISPDLEIHIVETKIPDEITDNLDQKQELIKAPKVELQGLKVLGKIELPDTKKKSETETLVEGSEVKDEPIEIRKTSLNTRPSSPRRERVEQRPRKNPIALAREQEEAEARKKREAEAESAKEQRTKNYYKKVKVSSPTKTARFIDEPAQEMQETEKHDTPKSWFSKLAKWFKS